MKRLILMLLLLPSLGVCSATSYPNHALAFYTQGTPIHGHSNPIIDLLDRVYRNQYNIEVPVHPRHYPYYDNHRYNPHHAHRDYNEHSHHHGHDNNNYADNPYRHGHD